MDKAINELEKISSDKKIIGLYDAEKVAEKVMNSRLNYAEKQGIAKGIKKGQKEGKVEIAKNMLKEKLNITLISKLTNLSIEEITKLR